MTQEVKEFIRISPGFKAAVNLRKERHNLEKVAGYIPTEVAREIILDFAKKLHPTTPDLRSRIVMGTYGTGKSHLALVLLNLFLRPLETPELQTVSEKLDPDTRAVLRQHRQAVPAPYLAVGLYGDEGHIGDSLMMGLRRALLEAKLENILPPTAFDSAIKRIEELEKEYPASFEILKHEAAERSKTIDELKTRLREYQKDAFDLFREVYPAATSGSQFQYTSRIDPATFYEDVNRELRKDHGYSGIVVLWDEFGHKMEEVVKDPTGKEGLTLQNFAECCNASAENQLHLYLFCHRSLNEYHDISRSASSFSHQNLEDDLRKIEGRFKQYILKSTDDETFQLIAGVIVADGQAPGWQELTTSFAGYFDALVQETARLNYFTGFTRDELKATVVMGAYPLHPMAVYSLPAVSEKVAQNNRTLFTCLCEDEPGSFRRFLDKALLDPSRLAPPMFTVDRLWDYFSRDIKQQERTYSIFRDFEQLKARLTPDDNFGLRTLKAVSVFRVFNPARFKMTEDILLYSLDVAADSREHYLTELARHSDLKNENHILIRLPSDGSYRPAVSSSTETLMEKVRKIIEDTPEKLGQKSLPYLKSLWPNLPVTSSLEATGYGDDFGVYRQLTVEPVSMYQIRERLHIITQNLGNGSFVDGLLLVLLCETSGEIEEARKIAETTLAGKQYQQVVLAIPRQPAKIARLLLEHQALAYLKGNEASLYAEGGELHEEWQVWEQDKNTQLTDAISDIVTPEKQALEYYWKGQAHEAQNSRQLKKLATAIMLDTFPFCPHIGDQKLAQDDFGGNWGYRKECRDIVLKLAGNDAAETLWRETAAAPQHVITLLLKSNGLLRKDQAGDIVIQPPGNDEYPGAHQLWVLIDDFLNKARQRPVEMKKLVTQLRKSPYGLKCRVMPIFFAAVAHHELALGNISFEFQRSANQVEMITTIESDTLEKVFAAPDKYKLVYVNVSSNQNAVVAGMAKVFDVMLAPTDPALERVKKVGKSVGLWWRGLARHAQSTANISGDAGMLRDYIFKPLAELDPDTQKILLRDAFVHVFYAGEKVKQGGVERLFEEIKGEFEEAPAKLRRKVIEECLKNFEGDSDGIGSVWKWFDALPDETKNFMHHGDPAVLVGCCRETEAIDENSLIRLAEKLTGLPVTSWADEMVVKFSAKLDSAKKYIESFEPPAMPGAMSGPDLDPIRPDHVGLTIAFPSGESKRRVFEVVEELSPNGHALANMLDATVEQIGRSLDEKEKTMILYHFLKKHFFGTGS
ncbi:MAG: hypothetical protein P4L55_12460 [Syntrophobacteraceae bacterium]|nr:hypothetical protein [Syntrophobacteraceae bacterium]